MSARETEQKRILEDGLKEGIVNACKVLKFDPVDILEVFERIRSLNGIYTHMISKKKRLKGAKVIAWMECDYEPAYYHIYIVTQTDRKSEPKRKKLLTLNGYYNHFFESSRIISEALWEDEDTFVVLGKKAELTRIRFTYSLSKDTIETNFILDQDVNEAEFMEEFDLATTEDPIKIEVILNNKDLNKWHIYL